MRIQTSSLKSPGLAPSACVPMRATACPEVSHFNARRQLLAWILLLGRPVHPCQGSSFWNFRWTLVLHSRDGSLILWKNGDLVELSWQLIEELSWYFCLAVISVTSAHIYFTFTCLHFFSLLVYPDYPEICQPSVSLLCQYIYSWQVEVEG